MCQILLVGFTKFRVKSRVYLEDGCHEVQGYVLCVIPFFAVICVQIRLAQLNHVAYGLYFVRSLLVCDMIFPVLIFESSSTSGSSQKLLLLSLDF